ncbi:Aste57867_2414 [Aphanomyces stellatus]|uniref:Aste57867_2414 protein n=1 Tax=Aphanomyces stellatus TaxID=120398 RepID=A0A485K7H5_9STRA|nr:hypothetical protein As57867_002408 [Aphanomyces stellatus]VFT79615.1 Aste57867_2414 [Aphanomyces stellatus]
MLADETTALVHDDLVVTASWFVEDAFSGISRPHPVQSPLATRMHMVYSEMHYVRGLAIVSLLGLRFFEPPAWCLPRKLLSPDDVVCGDPLDPATPPSFNLAWLSTRQSLMIEVTCLVVLLANVVVRYLYLQDAFTRRKDSVAVAVLVVVSLLLLGVSVVVPDRAFLAIQITGYLRVLLFAVKTRRIRRTLRSVWLVVLEVQPIASVVVVFVAFFAWTATILFKNTPEGQEYMPTFVESGWNLMVLLTTANFPDVMMPAYQQNRVAVLFFAFFLCFGLFFLMNVVLAVIFDHFARHVKVVHAQRDRTRRQKLQIAFDLLCPVSGPRRHMWSSKDLWDHRHDEWFMGEPAPHQGIPYNVMTRLCHQLNHYKNIAYIHPSRMRHLLALMDTGHTQSIHWADFERICDVWPVALRNLRDFKPSEVERWWPHVFQSTWYTTLRHAVSSPTFDLVVDIILVVNTVVVVVETLPILIDPAYVMDDDNKWGAWEQVELVFSFAYVVEGLVKMLVLGSSRYWASTQNRFDCILTLAILTVDIYVYLPENAASIVLVKILLVARCLRLLRLLVRIKRYRVFCITWIRLLPFGKNVLLCMFCVMYLFALLGMQLFGGLISPDVMVSQFPSSPYTQANYTANNFNDVASGIVTLFELLVVNNWQVIVDGHVNVTSKYARWFFIAYYFVSVTLLFNLVIASILEAFVDEYQANGTEQNSEYSDDRASVQSTVDMKGSF